VVSDAGQVVEKLGTRPPSYRSLLLNRRALDGETERVVLVSDEVGGTL
jgi:hypothetical protein